MEVLVFVANSMYVVAYFTSDMLRLRTLTVAAALCLVVYFISQPQPMWSVVGWNMFFVALNVFQISRIWQARRVVDRSSCPSAQAASP